MTSTISHKKPERHPPMPPTPAPGLPRFKGCCPKCKSHTIDKEYHAPNCTQWFGHYNYDCASDGAHTSKEHLVNSCPSCGFIWISHCADYF